MPLGTFGQGLGPYWGIVQPVAKTNYWMNPSFEVGTNGAAGLNSLTVGSTAGSQAFGAWSCWCAPSQANGTGGVVFGATGNGSMITTQNGTYTASAYVKGTNGVSYMIAVANANGANYIGSTTFTGGGTWHRYSVTLGEPSSGVPRTIVVKKNGDTSAASAGTFYVDGVQFEDTYLTSYLDGDGHDGTWLGDTHASQSYRSGQVRTGGSVIALADLGFLVEESLGIGMPPVENNSQSYAILDGAEFQRQRAAQRTITLTSLIDGNTQQDFHYNRRRLIDAIKMDVVRDPQPVRLVYIGAGGTSTIDAVYQSGLEGGDQTGFTEQASIQLVAYDPYWRSEREVGTTLAPRTNLGSVNFLAYRDPAGRWGTLGDQVNDTVRALLQLSSGVLMVGGAFGSAGGTVVRGVAQWSGGAWGTLPGGAATAGTPAGPVYALTRNPAGTMFAGGDFTTVAGTAGAKYIAQYVNNLWGTLSGGTLDNVVYALEYNKFGTMFAGGSLVTAGGTQARYIARYTGAWGTLTGGTVNAQVYAIKSTLGGTVYVGGDIGSAGAVPARGIAHWTPAGWGSVGGTWGGDTATMTGQVFSQLPSGELVAAGHFITIGTTDASGTYNEIAKWNGAGWSHFGSGLGTSTNEWVYALAQDSNNVLWAGGVIVTASLRASRSNLVRFVGNQWIAADILIPPTLANAVRAMIQTASGTMYVGGAFSGTMYAASVAQLVNPGMAQTYPRVQMRNTGAGTARVSQLVNTTTNTAVYFDDLIILGGETVTVDFAARSIDSDIFGNLVSVMLASSDLARWRLLPGTNQVSFLADSDSLTTAIVYAPRQWSADGTI